MKERTLVICDDDREYIGRLGRYISGKSELKLNVACFSEKKRLEEYIQTHPADIFLAGAGWINEELCPERRRWILLAKEKDEFAERCGAIYRYQSAEEICRLLGQQLKIPGTGAAVNGSPCLLAGIYGPAGWTETTRLALALAGHLAREGPTVYIGLNEFSPIMGLAGKIKSYDLSDVAYCWRRGRLTYEQLERITSHLEGFDCIPAPVNPAELAELSAQETEDLLAAVCAVGGYARAVLDFGAAISGRHTVFEQCGKVIVLFPDTETGLRQQEEFKRFWESVGARALLERSVCAVLPLEELRSGRKGKLEDYINELAERLLGGEGTDAVSGGNTLWRGD